MTKEEFKNKGFQTIETPELPQLGNLEALQDYIQKNKLNHPENLGSLVNLVKILVEDEKVNGYGLNFVGRNFARAKYAQKTEKELSLNTVLSKDIDNTQNLMLKGDNLDSLKILKNHYSGKIKCIYIDPPYNTTSDEFVYPDKFDKEEAEVLGFQNLSESDFQRMDFSFKTQKSHNGWLAFMYPRLLLARDLLSKEGVIFISIDDNEQANLKLLCDEVFGEENFVANVTVIVKPEGRRYGFFAKTHEQILVFAKNLNAALLNEIHTEGSSYQYFDEIGGFNLIGLRNRNVQAFNSSNRPNLFYPFYVDINNPDKNGLCNVSIEPIEGYIKVMPSTIDGLKSVWRWGKEKSQKESELLKAYSGKDGEVRIFQKERKLTQTPKTVWLDKKFISNKGTSELQDMIGKGVFDFPKPVELLKLITEIGVNDSDIILDFFAGSGTTGHAVMQLNAEDGGNRKFILCQIDEPIKKDKPAYQFCIENNLPPVISSITVERLKRAGEKIAKEIAEANSKNGMFPEDKKQVPDIGFKVFDSVQAPKLQVDEKTLQIAITENEIDAISRIYNMIFTVGLDDPTQVPETVLENCIYKMGNHYYLTNSEKINSDDYANVVKNGKVFIDGWTASLNGTLQHYKEEVKIVF